MSESIESCRTKLTHLEIRCMYENLQGHECVLMLRTLCQTYQSRISPITWFVSKLEGELGL